MNKKEFLTEERYEKTNKKVKTIGFTLMGIGLTVAICLVAAGLIKTNEIKEKYSKEKYDNLISETKEQLDAEKENLKTILANLEADIQDELDEIKKLERVKFEGFNDAYYKRQDRMDEIKKQIKPIQEDIYDIENCIEDSICMSNNDKLEKYQTLNSKYLEYKNTDLEHKIKWETSDYTFLYALAFMALFIGFGFGGMIILMSKRRELLAYTAQQVMPIAQEGMEKMAPSVGKAGKTIMDEMAPAYGKLAKEISKNIKEGLDDK